MGKKESEEREPTQVNSKYVANVDRSKGKNSLLPSRKDIIIRKIRNSIYNFVAASNIRSLNIILRFESKGNKVLKGSSCEMRRAAKVEVVLRLVRKYTFIEAELDEPPPS